SPWPNERDPPAGRLRTGFEPSASFVPKHRGCRDPRMQFSPDGLNGSGCVRVDPPRCAPVVTQVVTQGFQLSTCGRAEPEGFQLGPSTGGQRAETHRLRPWGAIKL